MKNFYIIKDRLNEALKMREMTASQLADKSGLNKSSICRYLQGERVPRSDAVAKMATALNVDPAWIIGYDVTPDLIIQLDDQDFICEVQTLSPESIEILKKKVQTFAKDYLEVLKAKEERNNGNT